MAVSLTITKGARDSGIQSLELLYSPTSAKWGDIYRWH